MRTLKVCDLNRNVLCELIQNDGCGATHINHHSSISEIDEIVFDFPINNPKSKYLDNENLILYFNEYYVIKNVVKCHDEENKLYLKVSCSHLSVKLSSDLISIEEVTPVNILSLMKVALQYDDQGVSRSGWQIGVVDIDKTIYRGLEANDESPFSILLQIADKFNAYPRFNSQNLTVDMLPLVKTDIPSIDFRVNKNLKSFEVTYDTSSMITKMYCYGGADSEGNPIDIMNVNPTGLPYIENYQYFLAKGYTMDYITKHPEMFCMVSKFEDDSYYDEEDLYQASVKELDKASKPKIEVKMSALDLSKAKGVTISDKDKIVNLEVGDCIRIVDSLLGLDFLCNVTSRDTNHDEEHLLSMEITSNIEFKDLLKDLFNSVSKVNSITTSSGNIIGSKVEGLTTDNIFTNNLETENLTAKLAEINALIANSATVEWIKANYIDATSIGAKYATIANLEAVKATIQDLDVTGLSAKVAIIENAQIDTAKIINLIGTNAEFENFTAENTIIKNLTAQKAEIDELQATSITTGVLDAYKIEVENLYAKKQYVDELDAENLKAKKAEITYAKIDELNTTNANITNLNAEITKTNELVAKKAEITDLNATNASIETLETDVALIDKAMLNKLEASDLTAINADITSLKAEDVKINKALIDKANITELNAVNATIGTLSSDYGEFKKLTADQISANSADIGELDAGLANINSIMAGNVGTGLVQTLHLTAKNVVIDDAVIKSAMIDELDVSKLKAGVISTDKFTIASDNGGIQIVGSTQQFTDKNGKVRLQVGQDAQGNFNFIVFGEDGKTTIYDENGVTSHAVPDGLIVDQMVADNANIQANKIQYIDQDGNTTLQTHLDVEQGKISSLISETTILTETVETVEAVANQAKTTATSASTVATEAKNKADTAKSTADNANTKAITAQTTADNKAKVFTAQPTTPYKIGDLWVQGTAGNIMKCKTARASGTYTASDWEKADKYTDDTKANVVQASLTTLTNRYNQTEQTVAGNTTTIGNVSTTVNDLTNEVESMDSRITQIKTTADGVNTTVTANKSKWDKASADAINAQTIANQTAEKFTWIVKSGTNSTNFELTDRVANLTAEKINLNGWVTFGGLATDAQSKINTATSNASSALSTANTAKTTADSAKSTATTAQTTANTAKSTADSANTKATNAQTAANNAQTSANNAADLAKAMANGKCLYPDIDFRIGFNGVFYYNNSSATAPSAVAITRIAKPADCPTKSDYCLEIKLVGNASPSYGGFYQNIPARANAIFVQRFVAKLPVGYKFNTASNSMGSGYTDKFVTSSEGTGKYQEYIRITRCGATGTFSIGGYVHISGSPAPTTSAPVYCYLASCTDYDITEPNILDSIISTNVIPGVSTINGGYITSNTITTNQLNTTEILAQNGTFLGVINSQEINANRITSGTIRANLISMYGLLVKNKTSNKETLSIDDNGNVLLRGSVESYDYTSGKTGWSIKSDGSTEFNELFARGSIITNDAGIVSAGGSGRNLILNSILSDTAGWTLHTSTTNTYCGLTNGYGSCGGYEFRSGVSGNMGIYQYPPFSSTSLPVGTYTLSMWIYPKVLGSSILGFNFSGGKINTNSSLTLNKWQHTSITFTVTSAITRPPFYLVSSGFQGIVSAIKLEKGDIATAHSLAPEDAVKQVRFWAGAPYEQRDFAPYRVYNDGSIVATKGDFSGVFSGEIKIGNINIKDPSTTSGGDALLTITNGQNGIKQIQLTDSGHSDFAQNINVTNNTYGKTIQLRQDGSIIANSSISVMNGSLSTQIYQNRIDMNGTIISGINNIITLDASQINLGDVSTNNLNSINMNAKTIFNKQSTFLKDITFGSVFSLTIQTNGIDFDFIG